MNRPALTLFCPPKASRGGLARSAGMAILACFISPALAQQAQSPVPNAIPDATTGSQSGVSPLPDSPDIAMAQTSSPSSEPAPPAASTPSPQQNPASPLGTAAAEEIGPSGVAASRPVGSALAPMRQRRVRLLLIKVGAVAAAGAAIGTTVALSHASPSRPPGSH
jgi:hypothetical protein